MAGRLRSSRMNESVLGEGLRRGMIEMNEGMKRVLGKIESSRDLTYEGVKNSVMRGFEGMAMVLEKAVKGIGERLAEDVRKKDRGERELEERIKWLEDRVCLQRRGGVDEERKREERVQSLEQRTEEREEEDRRREERLHALEKKMKEVEKSERERIKAMHTRVNLLVGKVETLTKGKESLKDSEKKQEEERTIKRAGEGNERDGSEYRRRGNSGTGCEKDAENRGEGNACKGGKGCERMCH